MKIQSINPSTHKLIGEVEASSEQNIIQAVNRAQQAKQSWKEIRATGRVEHLRRLYEVFEINQEEYAQLASTEMGMPINDSRLDIEEGLHYFKWYLDNAVAILAPEISFEDESMVHTVYREPIGVAAVIVPWNFPFSNIIWQVIPNLIAGNTVIFKASEEVLFCGKKMEEYFAAAQLPTGVFQEIYGDGVIGDFLIHQNIDLISFTGSSKVGKHIYQVAAEKFIKVVLELGGSAPGIIFEDANLDEILPTVFGNRFLYGGQICDGLKRLLVHESIINQVTHQLTEMVEAKKIGIATDPSTELGPLVANRQVDLIRAQVENAINLGATAITGGKQPIGLSGAFYEPTILVDVKPNMTVWREEVFGPVIPVVAFNSEAEVIKLANDTNYGLGGYIFTRDIEKAKRVAEQLDTGMVSINNASYLQPSSPFGGYKSSGIGREHGKYGLHDLTQIKVIATPK